MARMKSPASGATVRMYRQGHGDCFLLAFRKDDDSHFYMLIDCGLVSGSQVDAKTPQVIDIDDIVNDIKEATGSHLDVVVITHEHKDHVSGFAAKRFDDFNIDKLWLAWTENENHELAGELRESYNDTLLGLVSAARGMRAAGEDFDEQVLGLLDLESGDDVFGATSIKGITNKKAIKAIKDLADKNKGTRYLLPHEPPIRLPNVPGVRIFVLGPPENRALLEDPDPRDDGEAYHTFAPLAMEAAGFLAGANGTGAGLLGATESQDALDASIPFAPRYWLKLDDLPHEERRFFGHHYLERLNTDGKDVNAWRRIDRDWMMQAGRLALRLNDYTNNTSVVLAIELEGTGKVLLFVGDAQRGNWVSWRSKSWTQADGLAPNEGEITVDNLLARTVLYKVGHHGSHNATLKTDGLEKMGLDEYADEFVALIPANSDWAYNKSHPWRHPLESIEKALKKKARGRVLQIDVDRARKPSNVGTAEWKRFTDRSVEARLYKEITVHDG